MAADPSQAAEDEPISAINITPFVDVVLVLLVIFMVTAPMILKDTLAVRLPKSGVSDGRTADTTLSIVVLKNGNFMVDGVLAAADDVRAAAQAALTKDPQAQAIVSADEEAMHKFVVEAIDLVKGAGIARFAIQIEKKTP